ncbi:energy transducer TonB [Massilia sp. CF038]|uniref:energy transducer TonB n=1 Tax=Massilia sp. CF038 TaxID=1881045 RepID=UPI000924A0BD|nr:energy transducer TonB [Massilia sp. CF038]SHG53442.1 TonB family C-terminal domain-containing protein [Massilia sp. CF038]
MVARTLILQTLTVLALGAGPAWAQQSVSPELPQPANPQLDQFYQDHPDLRPAMRGPAAQASAAPRAAGKPCAGPAYPREARRLGQKGSVQLKFMIDTDGSVSEAEVEKSSGHPLLDNAGLAAIRLCKFQPALKDGRVIQSWHAVSYSWALDW